MYVSLPIGIWVRLFNLQDLSLQDLQEMATGFLRMRKTQREMAEGNEVEMRPFSTDQVSS